MTTPRDGVQIQPDRVRAVGWDVQGLGAQITGTVAGRDAEVQPTGQGDGWTTWTTFVRLGGAWLTEVRAIGGDLTDGGTSLVTAADTYEQTDQGAADRIRSHPEF